MEPVIGIIGGMGPWASVLMMRRILERFPVACEQDYPRIVLDSNAGIPDRTAAIMGRGPDPLAALIDTAGRLVAHGATILVMACNTAHVWHPALAGRFPCYFPSLITATAAALKREGRGGTVGLMATDGLIHTGLYQDELARTGLTCVLPAPDR